MDTIEKELKQGSTAYLLQQKPAASSDEERLAAGILTNGLQTKRLGSSADLLKLQGLLGIGKNHLPDPEGREGREETPEE
jgi:hypothetical protein